MLFSKPKILLLITFLFFYSELVFSVPQPSQVIVVNSSPIDVRLTDNTSSTSPVNAILDVSSLWEFGYWALGVSAAYLLFKDL